MRSVMLFLTLIPVFLFSQVREISLNEKWEFRRTGTKEWLPATVPGSVHTDLFKNKKIADPFSYQNNEISWIDTCDWEYRTFFSVSKDVSVGEADILFEGLDTYASVYLNDSHALEANNMFRSWKISARSYLKEGKNTLRIKFISAVKKGHELASELPYCLPEGERVFTRKAQYHFGWDFAPRFVTCGIWKNIKLVCWNTAKIKSIGFFIDTINTSKAVLSFRPQVDVAQEGKYEFVLSCKEHKGMNSILNTKVEKGEQELNMKYMVPAPQLWWCNGMGESFLYHFTLNLKRDGKVIDSKSIRVGIREIELVQDIDSIGQSFYFKLNGKPVFMKGANFVPPDVFLSRTTNNTYEELIKLAVRGNMNMLRVWGGGTYCNDVFYDLCDENGILVWQDFMFACAMYPGNKAFVENVKMEVKEQVARLSSRACLALWCGNNENDEGWKNWGWQDQFKYSTVDSSVIYNNYLSLFTKAIPEIIAGQYQDAGYNYIPSSPQHGWGRKESLNSGDCHYWGVWWGMEPFSIYNKKVGRFMSEYGFQGMPSEYSIKEYRPYTIKPTTAFINSRQKHPKGFETIDEYLKRDYPEGKSFEDFIYLSQLVQARGTEIAIEAHRRNKPRCMGSLFWQLNDCWPGITWSSIDYSGIPKASWYAAKNAFRDVLVSFTDAGDSIRVGISTDVEGHDLRSVLKIALYDFSGNISWSKELQVNIEAGSCKNYHTISKSILGNMKKEQVVLRASMKTLDGSIKPAEAYYYFVSPKNLVLEKATVTVTRGATTLEVTTNALAKSIFIDMGPEVTFSDNYFDLIPGEKRIIQLKGRITEDQKVKIVTLNDLVQP